MIRKKLLSIYMPQDKQPLQLVERLIGLVRSLIARCLPGCGGNTAVMTSNNKTVYAAGFPVAQYESVQKRMGPQQPLHPEMYRHYAGGWNAVRNRAMGCQKCADEYTSLFTKYGVSPAQEERIAQDNALFGFFAYALSTIESWFFAMHAVASILHPADFPMMTDSDLKGIMPTLASQRFDAAYTRSAISNVMKRVLSEPTYKEWKALRNILIHRAAPGRHFYHPPRPTGRNADWVGMGIVLDQNTLVSRYLWLTSVLERLVEAADQFTLQYFETR
jgi:hypothetical protein